MRKAFIPVLFLTSCLLGCNVPTQIVTPIQVKTPTAAITHLPSLTQIATIASEYPIIEVPILAIQVTDDEGGRDTKISALQAAAWISKANEIYTWSGIQFSFALHSTLLNNINGVEDQNWFEEVAYTDQVAARYPGKLVVFFRWGPGDQPTGSAFSYWDNNFVAMPGFLDTSVCFTRTAVFWRMRSAIFSGWCTPSPRCTKTRQRPQPPWRAMETTLLFFDGDGFSDTLPDPLIALDEYQCQPVPGDSLNGTFFPVSRENIMSYYEVLAF